VLYNLINLNGEGCNKLIAQGALLVILGEDIINVL
jgi:predicted Rossmann fold nucleotide-binding protein DprA/Smf involved in DNA uptake